LIKSSRPRSIKIYRNFLLRFLLKLNHQTATDESESFTERGLATDSFSPVVCLRKLKTVMFAVQYDWLRVTIISHQSIRQHCWLCELNIRPNQQLHLIGYIRIGLLLAMSTLHNVQRENITVAIGSFPNKSAGGLDGLRNQHLKEMTSSQCGHAADHLIDTLIAFNNIVLDGRVPSVI